jgi:hypothetical protein
LLSQKKWDLDEVEQVAMGTGSIDNSLVDALRRVCAIETPDLEAVTDTAERLRSTAVALKEIEGTDSARALQVAELLHQALVFHSRHGETDCPVCKSSGKLDVTWRAQTQKEIERLRLQAAQAAQALQEVSAASEAARRFLGPAPLALGQTSAADLMTDDASKLWAAWSKGASISDPKELADHLEANIRPLTKAVTEVCTKAHSELARHDDKWIPIATDIVAWTESARKAQEGASNLADIKKAEDWFKETASSIRNQRFAPIAEKATATWDVLKQQSNVKLGTVTLAGAGTTRKVELQVTVDDVEGAALSVMSQGELNALALSLFLPRATMSESPFGFIVIDDPVQSMDPSRVDGLARVLEGASKTHQVIVFTHDDRLPEATRRLGVEARITEVHRRQNSMVELRQSQHPVATYIEDAFTLAKTKDLPPDVARQVVPGFCRSAIEAACIEIVRRRRLRKGTPHTEVEELLVKEGKLRNLLALALFDDPERAGEVTGRINQEFGRRAGDTFLAVNKGAHEGSSGDLVELARDSEKLSKSILTLKT